MISNAKLIELYTAMVKCRMLGEQATGPHASNDASHESHEATAAGLAADLATGDTVTIPGAQFHASRLTAARLHRVFAALATEVNETPAAPSAKQDGANLESLLDAACEAAASHKSTKNGKISVVYSMNGEARTAHWKKALDYTNRKNLPVVFLTHRADHNPQTPSVRQVPKALAFGVPVISVDKDDVRAVYRVASESIARARQRRGPTLIEAVHTPHLNPGTSGLAQLEIHDPLLTMENFLVQKKLLDQKSKQKIHAQVRTNLGTATNSRAR